MGKNQVYNLKLKVKKNCTKICFVSESKVSMKRNKSLVFLNLLTKISVSMQALHLIEVT